MGTCCGVGGQSSNPHPIPRLPLPKNPTQYPVLPSKHHTPCALKSGTFKKKNGQARPSPFVDMTRVMWDGDCWTTLSIFPYSTFLQSRRHRCRFSAQYVAALGSAKSQKCNMFERGGWQTTWWGRSGDGPRNACRGLFYWGGVCDFFKKGWVLKEELGNIGLHIRYCLWSFELRVITVPGPCM